MVVSTRRLGDAEAVNAMAMVASSDVTVVFMGFFMVWIV
jgi:hypothetical protein